MNSQLTTKHLLPKLAAFGEANSEAGKASITEEKNSKTAVISTTASQPMAAVWGD